MDGHRQKETYGYNSGFWTLDQIFTWNNGVLPDCNQSTFPTWPSQETYRPQCQPVNALKLPPFELGDPVRRTSSTGTTSIPLTLPVEKPHVNLGSHTSSVTGHGFEPSMVSSRFSTPSLTDDSTIVPPYSSSGTEEPAGGSCVWTSPSIHSNGPIQHCNQLSPADFVRSRSLPTPSKILGTKDKFICLYAGCEANFRRVADLQRHVLKHINLVFSCPIPSCGGRTFTRKDKLLAHARLVHRGCPLTMFEAVDLHSKLHTTTTAAVSHDSRSVHDISPGGPSDDFPAVKGETSDFDIDCFISSTPSQLAITDPALEDSAQIAADVSIKVEGLTQVTGSDLLNSADKDVGLGQLKAISLSLWPPQYLALLELGGLHL